MKVFWKRYIALVIAITLVLTGGAYSSERFLKATDGTDEFVEGAETLQDGLLEESGTEEITVVEGELVGDVEEISQEPVDEEPLEQPDEQQELTDEEEELTEEPTYPAATVAVTASDGAVITVDAPEGTLPEGFTVWAAPMPISQSVVESVLGEGEVVSTVVFYDVKIFDKKGNEIQPSSNVSVRIQAPSMTAGESGYAFHVNDQGNVDKTAEVADANNAVISNDHFSGYGVVVVDQGGTNWYGWWMRSIQIDKTEISIGESIIATPVGFSNTSHVKKYIWESLNPDIATVARNANSPTATIKAKKPGTVTIRCIGTDEWAYIVLNIVDNNPDGEVYISVYATNGTANDAPELEKFLNLKYQQYDHYYPIGVITLPKKFFEGKTSPYINTAADLEAVKNAMSAIDTSYLIGQATGNAGNKVAENLDCVYVDLGKNQNSLRTAFFYWGKPEYEGSFKLIDNENYQYHLDLRFDTKIIKYHSVKQNQNGSYTVSDKVDLGESATLANMRITQGNPQLSAEDSEAFSPVGYYYDKACTRPVDFNNFVITKDTDIYVKLDRVKLSVNYDLAGGTSASSQFNFSDIKFGSKIKDVARVETPVKAGATFAGWDDGIGNILTPEEVLNTTVKRNITFTAVWNEKNVTILYSTSGRGSLDVNTETFNSETGTPKGSTATADGNYFFKGWVDENGTIVSSDPHFVPQKNDQGQYEGKTYTAVFEEKINLTLISKSLTVTYDGEVHKVKGFVTDGVTLTELTGNKYKLYLNGTHYIISGVTTITNGCTLENGEQRGDAGETAKVNAGEYGIQIVDRDKFKVTLLDETKVVTDRFQTPTYVEGKLVIKPRAATITSASATKVYDGTPLIRNNVETDITFDGFVKDDASKVTITFDQNSKATQRTEQKENQFNWRMTPDSLANNYVITPVYGILKFVDSNQKFEVTIKPADLTGAIYDGAERTVDIPVVIKGQNNLIFNSGISNFTISGVTAQVTATDAGEYTVTVSGTPVVTDALGNTVTDLFTISTETGKFTIPKRNVQLTSQNATKEYDGTPLTNSNVDVSGDGFAAGEGFTANVTGSQTLKGTSPNSFTYALTNAKESNYNITTTAGTLTVTDRAAKYVIDVTPNKPADAKYNGTLQSVNPGLVTNSFKLITGGVTYTYRVDGVVSGTAGTEVGSYRINVDTSAAKVYDENNNDVTSQFNVISTATVNFDIKPREIILTSETASKVYDGSALTKPVVTVSGDGFVNGDGITATATGSVILPGAMTTNTITYQLSEGVNPDNYSITKSEGTLSITNRPDDAKYEITVEANDGTFTYDGNEKTVTGFKTVEFTFDGKTYRVEGLTASGTGLDASDTAYAVSVNGTAKVVDEDGTDLTDQFIVNVKPGELKINKAKVTLTSSNATKPYDGTLLEKQEVTATGFAAGEGASYSSFAKLTVPGQINNTFEYELLSGTKASNYEIEKCFGQLTVTDLDAANKLNFTLEGKEAQFTYDGANHRLEGFKETTFTASNGQTYTVEYLGGTPYVEGKDAGTYPIVIDTTKITVKDSAGNDVTSQFNLTKNDGALVIAPRPVTITSASDTKIYDGTALTNSTVTVTSGSFVNGETPVYSVTGSRTLVGQAANTFTYTFPAGVKAENYAVTAEEGKLTVTDRDTKYEITIVGADNISDDVLYDGQPHTVGGFIVDGKLVESGKDLVVTVGGNVYTISGISASRTEINAGEYPVEITGTPVVKDDAGNDVTSQFNVKTTAGKLVIDKRKVTITSGTSEFEYDGKSHSDTSITVSGDGFATGEGANYAVYNSVKLPNETKANSFNVTLSDKTNPANYVINKVEGTISIRNRDAKYELTLKAVGGTFLYDGTEKSAGTIETRTFTVNDEIYTVEGVENPTVKAVNAGTYPITITVDPAKLVIKDSNDQVVTDQFTVKTTTANLVINKRTVILTSDSATQQFNGSGLSTPAVKVSGDGFAPGEGASYSNFTTQLMPGVWNNSFDYTLNEGTNPDNYIISTSFGSLNVTSRDVKYSVEMAPKSSVVYYDGQEHSVSGFDSYEFTEDGVKYVVEGVTAEAKGTEPGTYKVQITGVPEVYMVTEGKGLAVSIAGNPAENLADQFEVKFAEATLVIKPVKTLTINYVDENGTALSAPYVQRVPVGKPYGPIASPVIEGYTPEFGSISSDASGMPNQDVTVDVKYTKNQTPEPQQPEDNNQNPGNNPGGTTDNGGNDGGNTGGNDGGNAGGSDGGNAGGTGDNGANAGGNDGGTTAGGNTPQAATPVTNNPANAGGNTGGNTGNAGGNNAGDGAVTADAAGNAGGNAGGGNAENGINAVEIGDEEAPAGVISLDEDGNAFITEITDEETPLYASRGSWALVNLLSMAATVILAILVFVTYFMDKKSKKKEEESVLEDEEAKKKRMAQEDDERNKGILRIVEIIVAVTSVAAFLLTEDITMKMRYTDEWTILMVAILIAGIVVAFFCQKEKEKPDDDDSEYEPLV